MEKQIFIGIIALLVCTFISRIFSEKALKLLKDEDKAKLVTAFSNMRKYTLLPIIFIVLAIFIAIYLFPQHYKIINIASIIALALFIVTQNFIMFKKFKELKMQADYIKQFITSMVIRYTGLAIFIYFLIAYYFNKKPV